jgi:hypothetical protein
MGSWRAAGGPVNILFMPERLWLMGSKKRGTRLLRGPSLNLSGMLRAALAWEAQCI